jgi:hypothetical protein
MGTAETGEASRRSWVGPSKVVWALWTVGRMRGGSKWWSGLLRAGEEATFWEEVALWDLMEGLGAASGTWAGSSSD